MKFRVEKMLQNGLGRVGEIETAHGVIKTPAFMAVGTQGYVRFLSAADLRSVGAQAMLSNGFHLRRQAEAIAAAGGLATWRAEARSDGQEAAAWCGPTLTDSGGFQVMSLGSGLGKVVSMDKERRVTNTAHQERLAHVTEDGVDFVDPFDGQPERIGPEESMRIQCAIGADIHMAFDELTSLADSYEYNVEALERTERWAERSLREHLRLRDRLGYRQNLYGVLQGGRWEDLRRATARRLGVRVACDLNYRSKLWSEAEAGRVMRSLVQSVDLLIANEEHAERILGVPSSVDPGFLGRGYEAEIAGRRENCTRMARFMCEHYPLQSVALTLRTTLSAEETVTGAVYYDGTCAVHSRDYRLYAADRVGAGDAYAAGLLYSLSRGDSSSQANDFAAAACALAHTIPGDVSYVTAEEVERLVRDGSSRILR